MSTVVAQSHHVFGLQSQVANNIFFFDEQIIIFPAGNQCVRYNMDQKWQKFIPGSEKSQGMLALSISPNRRYLAVSEMVQEKPVITIYELSSIPVRKRKILNNFDFPVQKFTCMAFSPDSKYLLTQTSPPESNLVYWLWEKQKVMAIVRIDSQNNGVYQVSFGPQDNTQVCVTGNGMFKLLRFTEGTLKQTNFQRGEPQNYLAHTWVSDDRVVVGTDTGKLFLFESGDQRWETSIMLKEHASEMRNLEMIQESESLIEFPTMTSPIPSYEQVMMASSHSQLTLPQVFAVAAYSKGFACSAGPGRVLLFEKMEDKDFYHESKEIRIPVDPQSNNPSQCDKQDIVCMCFSPSEETLIATTSKNQLYSITMSLMEISKGEPAHFEYLMYPLHSASITGLATCIRKPFIATCSLDRSIRIWNYESNALELYKEYQEEAYAIGLHPSGHFIVVGFADKLRLMNLLIDDIRPFKEYSVRGCRECAFSNGGHLFAAVNGNVIHIFTTTSLENISNLKGHTGKIRSIAWNADDSKLVSCGTDGAVYEWNLSSGKRETECVLKSCSYNCVTISPDSKIIFAVGSDCTLKEIADSSVLREMSAFDAVYTAVVISHAGRMMFVGTSLGTIRAMKYPLPLQKEFNEYQAHAGPITKMLLTFDDQHLLTVAQDGCLYTWKVYDKEGRGIKREREVGFAEEVLVTKIDLEEKAQVMLELKTRVEELKMENEYQLRLKDMNYSEKMKDLTDKFIQEMESLKTKNQILKTEKEKQDIFHRECMDDLLEKQTRELQDLECCNNQKLLLEYEKYQELQLKSQRMQEEYEKQLRDNDETKSQALEELTEFYEAKLQEKTTLLEEAQEDVRQQLREFEETKKQIEEDEDREIQDIKTKYEKKLRDEKESNLRLKGETGIMRKKFSGLQKEIEERANDIEILKGEQLKLQGVIKSLEKDILGFKREIQERDETIQDKEKRIYDLKKKNQELEKFKFVLDYKIKELKKQIEPRENDIKVMKEQIQEMETELERFHKQNTQLELNITELWQKLRATNQEMRKEIQKERALEALVKQFKTDLHNCVAYIQEPQQLKDKIRGLFEKYVQRADMVEIAGLNTDLQQEYTRQREHLERNLATLKKKVVKESELHRSDYVRVMQENVSLIKEINELRRELKLTRSQVYDLEAALKLMKKIRPLEAPETAPRKVSLSIVPTRRLNEQEETGRIIEMQRLEIRRLRDQIQEQEQVPGFHPIAGINLPSLESKVDSEMQAK
ncbi:cilia and flagella associated protein 57 [Rhinolophus ferrumequinum]|uniref:Cilia- and flagella-associated protein 57 n=1 Tax=Rhinolophus ferrumequinum TaxID=59479 RepID=A0A671EGU7_RHIFE|nr:cilia- and flagella-associated protein 57 [Rhinolophus ferrumequinum]XP_032971216.1 cilia- and flagella-associated protein 57 [Rhinolophus ferrumequinum]KAF6344214.1 cilia and flagella associated protein 57 [Rhinolophus ferrumequinum]